MSISRRILRLFGNSRSYATCLLSNLNKSPVPRARWFSSNKDPSNEPKQFYRRPLPASCIAFASSEGRQIFKEALEMGFLESFYDLVPQFRTQVRLALSLLVSINARAFIRPFEPYIVSVVSYSDVFDMPFLHTFGIYT
ncbi:unnamed protein product [Rodentolepis nana]|uniref:Peptidase C83 domain-containing protein n=1 Tax=Rodentolepis nana TaxID=102285 RepID=A0A0R3TNR2_RODNA|nr:unnamed protein product [Rodentolepis nana]